MDEMEVEKSSYVPVDLAKMGATQIEQGAEGRVYKMNLYGKPTIVKERFEKKYRHPILDKKLTSSRLAHEARCMHKCNTVGVDTPGVYFVDKEGRRLYVEFIEGEKVKALLWKGISEDESNSLSEKIGKAIANIHDANIIHGDLTTSNMMIRNENKSLVMIDFGLSYVSTLPEDKGVDLYVLERAFLSTHPNSEKLFENILTNYGKFSKNSGSVLKKLEEVRMRGRKKIAFG